MLWLCVLLMMVLVCLIMCFCVCLNVFICCCVLMGRIVVWVLGCVLFVKL